MKPKLKVIGVIAAVAVLSLLLLPKEADSTPIVETPKPAPTYAQGVWISALEWCESHGVQTAVNAVDLDGTPSYYSYQFKPGTFRGYGEQYGIIPKGLSEADLHTAMASSTLQRAVVESMVLDYDNIRWDQQFPGCVRKLGYPPRY